MNLQRVGGRILGCLLLLGSSEAFAQADPNVEIMQKLYTKLGQVVGVGSNDVVVGETFLVLANPGVIVDPSIQTNTANGRYRLSRVLDRVLAPHWIYNPQNRFSMSVYDTVLKFKEPPIYVMSKAEKAELADARAVIYKNYQKGLYSDEFERFRTTRRALAQAAKSVEDFRRANPDESVPQTLIAALQEAVDDYELVGNKDKIIAAKDTIDRLEHLDPSTWWGELNERFNVTTEVFNGQRFGPYNLYPQYASWLDDSRTWTALKLTETDLEQINNSSHSSVGGGFGAGWGLWSIGGDYSETEARSYFRLDVSGYAISADLLRVDIDRPWMEALVFSSDAWRWLGSSPIKGLISDGADVTSGQTPKGVMPFLPTGVLLAKNVKLSGNWSADLKTTYEKHTSGGGHIGWGPFTFGGRKTTSDKQSYVKADAAGNEISFTHPQIIGFFVEVLPKSPNPRPGLKFRPTEDPLYLRVKSLMMSFK